MTGRARPRVLHLLSQRPGRTGSGVTLEALVRHAAARWDQEAVVGVPVDDPQPSVGGLDEARVHPLVFGAGDVPFGLPGMSDVMPYESRTFSSLSEEELETYRSAWLQKLDEVVARFRPDVIHTHHIWILSSLVKEVAPRVPVVSHCHATGLRQMALCPHLAPDVVAGCALHDAHVVLHGGHADELVDKLGASRERVHVVGAGFAEDVFHPQGRAGEAGPEVTYAGKLASAKGLPWLVEAAARLAARIPGFRLHVAGGGAGPEAEAIRKTLAGCAPWLVPHGVLSQPELAALLRRSRVFCLPSFYEGLPLVLVEAAACGCQLVCTELPALAELGPGLDGVLTRVPLPRLVGVDTPRSDDLGAFVDALEVGLAAALERPVTSPPDLGAYTWPAVAARVEAVWASLLTAGGER